MKESQKLFSKEEELIERVKALISKDSPEINETKLLLEEITHEFSDFVKSTAKLTKLSDVSQSKLKKIQDEIEFNNKTLEEKNRNLTLLSQVGKLVTSSLEMKDILLIIYSNIQAFLKTEVLMFGIREETQNCIKFKNILVRGQYIPGMQKDSLDDLNFSALCIQRKENIISNDVEKDFPKLKPIVDKQAGFSVESIAYFPLIVHNEIIGILGFQNEDKNLFSESVIELLKDMANFIAIGVDNANAYKKLSKRNKELKGTLEEIRNLNEGLEQEKQKSENLLLNILPVSIANRLKKGESTIADYYESSTVLFADIVGFSKLSVELGSPKKLVNILNNIFSSFDAIAYKYNLEKIKTIGDCYMMAGGIPVPCDDHAERCALASLEMLEQLNYLREKEGIAINFRIGLHTGNVVAGVIGTRKFVYDLWGDTVNTSSRMESHGIPGRVHCSDVFYELLKDKFIFEDRGEIEVKGKGIMHTYFLAGQRIDFVI
jgi:class 3 adenylate cyclase/GAF domain-containing protein